MFTKTLATAVLAGGLAFGVGMPAHAAEATCSMERVLVTAAVAGSPAVYGEAPLLSPAQEAWIERVLVTPAIEEVSHVVRHPAQYAERIVIDRPYAAAVPAVDEVSHLVHHEAVTEVVHHEAVVETVHHDAETKTIHHPAETTVVRHKRQKTIVRHEAVTEVVHHEATTRTEYTRYKWVGTGKAPVEGSTPLTDPAAWRADKKKYDGSATAVVIDLGSDGKKPFFYWNAVEVVVPAWDETVIVKKAWNEKVITPAWNETVVLKEAWDEAVVLKEAWDETVVVKEAWDETVVVKEAWDEKVIDVAGVPATPEQPELSHIEYDLVRDAWDETVIDVEAAEAVYADVEHPAVAAVYGDPALISEAIEAVPAVYNEVEVCENEAVDVVDAPAGDSDASGPDPVPAVTPAVIALPIAAGAAAAGGAAFVLIRRRGLGG